MSQFAHQVFDIKTRVAQRRVRAAFADMRRDEVLPADHVARLNALRACEIAQYAYTSSPFYRRKFAEAGLAVEDLRDPANWEHVPTLTKQDIREGGSEILAEGRSPRDKLASKTGGSTGEPLVVFHDRRSPVAAMWWRPYRWWGVSPADASAHIYRQSRTTWQELLHRAEWWPTRSILLNARGMDAVSMEAFVSTWAEVRPRLLVGYVDGVHEFARYVDASQRTLVPPAAVAVTASVLQESQRLDIERILGAPVYDCYRTAEIPWVAAQCTVRNGLHVMADLRRLEVLDEDGRPLPDGEEGELALTDFSNRVFPLIRYRIGDRSRILRESCSCGVTFPLIAPVQGRLADALKTPAGRMITGGLSVLFNQWPSAVRKFQIHQAADYSVTLRCVLGDSGESSLDAVKSVADTLDSMLGGSVPVRYELVDRIDHQGGKSRLVVSDIL